MSVNKISDEQMAIVLCHFFSFVTLDWQKVRAVNIKGIDDTHE
jgi:hypothetical protein